MRNFFLRNFVSQIPSGSYAYVYNPDTFADFNSAVAALDTAKTTLAEKEVLYQNGLADYQSGLASYNEKAAEYQTGQARLENARAILTQKEKELAEAKETLAQK